MWEDDSAHGRFWRKLIRSRAQEFAENKTFLQSLRYNPKLAASMQKRFGRVWAETHGADVYKLIGNAFGENWDAEDEQKSASARENMLPRMISKEDDDLAPTREESTRGWQHELQGIAEARQRVLEEEQRRQSREQGSRQQGSPQKAPQKKEGRRADFYRRAGGSG